MSDIPSASSEQAQPKWQPLEAVDRRVLGVLIEKGKTTPNAYPLTLNALVTGCNQKSNRHPVMQLEPEDIEDSVYRLRQMGAVAQVESSGRVSKYRHYAYEWLGVDKVEIAVMAELLLRGAQTEGELRGRAARMEAIADLTALRPVLASLKEKGLVLSLTPEGRGHVVTHALFTPREMEKVRREAAHAPVSVMDQAAPRPSSAATSPSAPASGGGEPLDGLRREANEMRSELGALRSDVEELIRTVDEIRTEFQRLKDDLGV